MTQKKKIGDFIVDMRVFDVPTGSIVERRKIKGKEAKEWEEFLSKFGITHVVGDKVKSKDDKSKKDIFG